MTHQEQKNNFIGIVGPCSAGKSTLIGKLEELGFSCHHIAQEHSYVPDMWQRLANPIALIYLDVSYTESMIRRPLNLNEVEFEEQKKRLSHAYQNADLNIDTNELAIEEVQKMVINFLERHNIQT